MNYELAKQLKDAGFPQDTEYYFDYRDGLLISKHSDYFWGSELNTSAPTLSELIKACMEIILKHNSWEKMTDEGLWFFQLAPNIHTQGDLEDIGKVSEWRASWFIGHSEDDWDFWHNKFGETPEEAVAKLWLELNPPSLPKA